MPEIITGLEFQQSEPATVTFSFDEQLQRLTDFVIRKSITVKSSD